MAGEVGGRGARGSQGRTRVVAYRILCHPRRAGAMKVLVAAGNIVIPSLLAREGVVAYRAF
jgi:hypothetical protein